MLSNRSLKIIFSLLLVYSSLFVFMNVNKMSSTSKLLSVDYKVFGRVQGVFFRKSTKEKADQIGINGWVKNDRDGTVVGVIQGGEDIIQQMKHWLSHVGSPYSKIEKCEFSNERAIDTLEFKSFTVNRG